jgi:hypothetical protein
LGGGWHSTSCSLTMTRHNLLPGGCSRRRSNWGWGCRWTPFPAAPTKP